jgi:hypothetical protein
MNCFNIREIQSILKRKFFTDLINTHDHHVLLDKTAMGLRFKTNNINSVNSNAFVFYNYGIEFAPKIRTSSYFFNNENSFNNITSFNTNSLFFSFIALFSQTSIFFFLNNFYFNIANYFNYITPINLMFKDFFNNLLLILFYFYDHTFTFLSMLFGIINNFFITFSIIIKNFKEIPNMILIFFFTYPIASITHSIILLTDSFFKNSLFSASFLFSKTTSASPSFNFFNHNFSFINFFYEFFFFIKFFEIFYLYNLSNQSSIFVYFSSFFFFNYISYYFNELKIFYFFNDKDSNVFLSYQINKNNSSKTYDNNFFTDNTFALHENISFFNNSFYSKLDYNSYFIYFYLILYSLFNLPFYLYSMVINIFNVKEVFSILSYIYEFITL